MTATVFISHADEDTERCGPLLKTLGAWQIPCYFDATDRRAGGSLDVQAQQALVQSDVTLRICTRHTNRSYWMSIEAGALLSLQADDYRAGQAGRHRLVNLILDTGYRPEPFDVNATNVNATNVSASAWVNVLRVALDLTPLSETASVAQAINPPTAQRLSRRAVIGLGAGGVALVAAGAAGALWLERRGGATTRATPPSSDASLRWWAFAASAHGLIGQIIDAAPVVDSDAVYIATLEARVLALSLSGRPLWQLDLGTGAGFVQTPIVAQGTLYGVNRHDGVYAIREGKRLWFDAGDPGSETAVSLTANRLYANAALLNSGAYAFITILDPTTGAQLSGATVPSSTPGTSAVTVAGDLLICGGFDGYLYAIDATHPQSAPRWQAEVGAARMAKENGTNHYAVFSPPVVANGIVYAGSTDFNVYAIDLNTGARRWRFPTQAAINEAEPVVVDGVVYVASQDHSVYALDARTGKLRWRHSTGSALISAPTVTGGVVYFGSGDRAVYALDSQSGALRHAYTTTAGVRAQPAIAGGVLYAADVSGYVYAFTLK